MAFGLAGLENKRNFHGTLMVGARSEERVYICVVRHSFYFSFSQFQKKVVE